MIIYVVIIELVHTYRTHLIFDNYDVNEYKTIKFSICVNCQFLLVRLSEVLTSSNLLNNSILIMCPYPCQVMHNIQTHKEIVICSKEHSKNSLVYEYRSYTNYNTTVYNNYVILCMA